MFEAGSSEYRSCPDNGRSHYHCIGPRTSSGPARSKPAWPWDAEDVQSGSRFVADRFAGSGKLGKGTTMPLPPKVIIPLFPRAIVVSGAFEHPLLVPVTMPAAEIVGVVAVSRAHIVIFVKNRLPVLILVAKLNFPYGRRVENISGIV